MHTTRLSSWGGGCIHLQQRWIHPNGFTTTLLDTPTPWIQPRWIRTPGCTPMDASCWMQSPSMHPCYPDGYTLDRITDSRLRKHYLLANSFANGNNSALCPWTETHPNVTPLPWIKYRGGIHRLHCNDNSTHRLWTKDEDYHSWHGTIYQHRTSVNRLC